MRCFKTMTISFTGAKSGEIRPIPNDNVLKDSLVVRGK